MMPQVPDRLGEQSQQHAAVRRREHRVTRRKKMFLEQPLDVLALQPDPIFEPASLRLWRVTVPDAGEQQERTARHYLLAASARIARFQHPAAAGDEMNLQ